MRHRNRPAVAALAIALTCAAAGCSPAGNTAAKSGESAASTTTVISSCGRQLAFAQPPTRALTLDQTSTETLLELGVQDRMTGTANLKTKIPARYQDAYRTVPVVAPKIATGEQVRAATPDFVVASSTDLYTKDRAGTREELAALRLPTFVSAVDCPQHSARGTTPFELLFSDYEKLGKVFGVDERAARLVAQQRAAVAAAGASASTTTPRGTPPTVVYLYSIFNGMPYVAGRTGLPSEISRIVGAKNAFDDVNEDWPEVSWEEVAQRNPDFLVIGDLSERGRPGDSATEKRAILAKDPAISRLPAVRDHRIIEVPGIELDPSVRSVHALALVAAGMKHLGHAR
ncbi:ABC transporter substrate-binding protein [Streptomyces sp. NPDC006733]|uniref:ABC transporter substrate-binding protein n=1 Tax=Streptomyces sp. NPDC006733 TaxID=3155460 RepID=UPI00340830FF